MPKNPLYVGEIRVDNRPNQRVYPIVNPTNAVSAKAATAALTAADFDKTLTNTGASGTVALTLPSVAISKGRCIRIQVTVAQIVQADPSGTESIYLGGSGAAGKYLNIAGVIGNYADLYCDGSNWMVTGYAGVLTKEA